jgi:hypothetical protein
MRCREFFVEKTICAQTSHRAECRAGLNKKAAVMLLSIAGASFAGVAACSALLILLF